MDISISVMARLTHICTNITLFFPTGVSSNHLEIFFSLYPDIVSSSDTNPHTPIIITL